MREGRCLCFSYPILYGTNAGRYFSLSIHSLIINILGIQQLIHPLPEFALLGRLRHLDHIPLVGIDDRCVQIMADPWLVTTIVHMYMTVEKISRLIMLHDPAEAPEALVRQILGIAKILCRCMCHQNVQSAADADLPFQVDHR